MNKRNINRKQIVTLVGQSISSTVFIIKSSREVLKFHSKRERNILFTGLDPFFHSRNIQFLAHILLHIVIKRNKNISSFHCSTMSGIIFSAEIQRTRLGRSPAVAIHRWLSLPTTPRQCLGPTCTTGQQFKSLAWEFISVKPLTKLFFICDISLSVNCFPIKLFPVSFPPMFKSLWASFRWSKQD